MFSIFSYHLKKCNLKIFFQSYKYMSKTMNSENRVAVCQMTSTNNKEINFNQVELLVQKGKKQNAKVIFLPENCDYIGENSDETIQLAESLNGPLLTKYKNLAKNYNVWLSLGSIHEAACNNKIFNTHVLIDSEGKIVSTYRKLHLFNVEMPEEKIFLSESKIANPGEHIVTPITSPVGKIGLSICYDLRFPELNIVLRERGADILTYPSAFTYPTGLAHWQTLLQARAIESQCYVLAAAQMGIHNEKRISYGQALIVDPWGKVISECPKYQEDIKNVEPSLCSAVIDLDYLNSIRKKMPVMQHRRTDIYGNLNEIAKFEPKIESSYKFSDKTIEASTVFYTSNLSYAFTNIRCVVPGHVLVAPLRKAERMYHLTTSEVNDLFQTVVLVQKAVEFFYKASSSTVTVQDGKDAGQTVKHVHVHIMPRLPGDFAINDEIYLKMATHEQEATSNPPRSLEERSAEAQNLALIIKNEL